MAQSARPPVRAGHISFCSSHSQGPEANLHLRVASLRFHAGSCQASPEPRVTQCLWSHFQWSSSSYPIPSVGTQVCTQLRGWEMSLLLSSLKKLQAVILQALPLLVSRVNLTFPGFHLGIVRHFVLGPSVHEQLGWGPITSSAPTCAPCCFPQGFCSQQNNSESLTPRTIQSLNLLLNLPVSLGFLLVPPAGSNQP